MQVAPLGLLAEELLQVWPVLLPSPNVEWNGDLGPVLVRHVVHVETVRQVDGLVDLVGLPAGLLLGDVEAAVVRDLAQHKVQGADGKDVGGVPQVGDGLGGRGGGVAQDSWADGELPAEEGVVDDDDDASAWAQVLAPASVDDSVLAHVNWPGEQSGREVRDDGHVGGSHRWVLDELQAVDSLVGADVDVRPLGVDLPLGGLWVHELSILVGGEGLDHHRLAVLLGLVGGLVGPEAPVHVRCLLLAAEKVERQGRELAVRSSLHQQDVVVVRNVQDLPEQIAHVAHARLHRPSDVPVAVLDEAHARGLVGQELVLQVEQNLVAHGRGTGAKVGDALPAADDALSDVLAAQKGPPLAAELLLLLKLLELWAQGVAGVVGHARGHRGVIGRHDGWSRRCLLSSSWDRYMQARTLKRRSRSEFGVGGVRTTSCYGI
mmetsp:Transcript_423/g.1673  ORF Transcript_423/g.1673 Transcript_423/m.1673 type:complete len:433 (+) Transcript_423:296-1594(+)